MKKARRRSVLTPQKLAKFLDVLAQGLSVTSAAEAIVASRERLYELRRADQDLAAAWDAAIEAGTDKLEAKARARALLEAGHSIREAALATGLGYGTLARLDR
jgi:hypothetical protein